MKKTTVLLLSLLLVCSSFFSGCTKPEDGAYTAPVTISEKMAGTWALSPNKGLLQDDEIAKANSEPVTEMDLTGQFTFSSFTITFNVDADNKPTGYSVGGTSPAFFPKTGYWDLDYPYPSTQGNASKIYLFSDAAKTTKTATLEIMNIPGADPTLKFKLIRRVKGVAFVSYTYKLSIQK